MPQKMCRGPKTTQWSVQEKTHGIKLRLSGSHVEWQAPFPTELSPWPSPLFIPFHFVYSFALGQGL